MDYRITKDFLNKARNQIKNHAPYAENDPILDQYDGDKDFEKWRSTMLVRMLKELGYDPYDDNDYGSLTA